MDEPAPRPDPVVESAAPNALEVPAKRVLTPEAERALAEAESRRAAAAAEEPPREIDGRGGLEPVRYGDWEIKGLTADF
ncbi:MAG TPA: DUF1674 domain-containing protein [Methylomirabilota bacterium]|nr:DUF1674 domain-containing protein [Methylomirabilota bacterium]